MLISFVKLLRSYRPKRISCWHQWLMGLACLPAIILFYLFINPTEPVQPFNDLPISSAQQSIPAQSGLVNSANTTSDMVLDVDEPLSVPPVIASVLPSVEADLISEVSDPELIRHLDMEAQFSAIYHITLDLGRLSQSVQGQSLRLRLPHGIFVEVEVDQNTLIGGHQISFKEISGYQSVKDRSLDGLSDPLMEPLGLLPVQFVRDYAIKLLVSPDYGLIFGDVNTTLGQFRVETFRGEVYLLKFPGMPVTSSTAV